MGQSIPTSDLDATIRFVMKLSSALHRFGASTNRLEDAINNLSQQLAIDVQFLAIQTSLIASFRDGNQLRTEVVRLGPGEINLDKLCSLDEIGDRVVAARVTVAEAIEQIDEIIAGPPKHGMASMFLAFALGSASICVLLQGGLFEVAISALGGLSIAALHLITLRVPGVGSVFESVFESIAAFLVSAMTLAFLHFFPTLAGELVILSGLIILIPGLSLTIAVTELATSHLLAGTARLMGAGVVFLKIGIGVALASQIGRAFSINLSNAPIDRLPAWVEWPTICLASLAFVILFQGRFRDTVWVLLVGGLGILSVKLGAVYFDMSLASFFGGLTIGLMSNVFARVFRRPASVTLLPSIILLVPGSVGFKSVLMMFNQDVVSGMQTVFAMLTTAIALVSGLFLSKILVGPKRSF